MRTLVRLRRAKPILPLTLKDEVKPRPTGQRGGRLLLGVGAQIALLGKAAQACHAEEQSRLNEVVSRYLSRIKRILKLKYFRCGASR